MEGPNDMTVDMTAEMAALGLPSSFIARVDHSPSTAKNKVKRRPPSTVDLRGPAATGDSKHESCTAGPESCTATDESNTSLRNFCVTSVKLYTPKKDPGLEVEGFELLDCSRTESQQEIALIDGEGDGGNVPLIYGGAGEHTEADVVLGVVEESCSLAESEDLRHIKWEPVWDEQYQCYYFCNTRTWESTWEAPPGYENYAATNFLDAPVQHHTNSLVNTEENTGGVVGDKVIDSEEGRDSGLSEDSLIRGGLVEQLANDAAEKEEKDQLSTFGIGKVEAMGEYGKDLKTADPKEGKGSYFAEISLPPDITNSHIRFKDSDESSSCSSSGEGEDEEIDWNDIRGEVPTQRIKKYTAEEDKDEDYKACSPSSKHWISFIHSKVGQHIKASKTCIKKRRLSSLSGVDQLAEVQLPGIDEMRSKKLIKYWIQRYSLFSKFDEGVKLDEESWFSVTPEIIARHQASRCVTGLVIDAFTGVGGNAIQFALRSHRVIAIDIDPMKVEYARHNAEIYGVADKIEYIVGDFFQLAPFLKADLVFLSPPWGGPEYLKQEVYDLYTMLKPKDGCTLFKAAQSIAPNITLFVPRNVDLNQLQELSWLASPPLSCEVEENYVNDKLKAITAYYREIAGEQF